MINMDRDVIKVIDHVIDSLCEHKSMAAQQGNDVEAQVYDDLTAYMDKYRFVTKKQQAAQAQIDAQFNIFWDAYPRKVAKPRCRKIFERVCYGKVAINVLVDAINRYKKTSQWQNEGGTYIPHPSTWLNGRQWEDDIDALPKPIKANGKCRDEERDYSDIESRIIDPLKDWKGGNGGF